MCQPRFRVVACGTKKMAHVPWRVTAFAVTLVALLGSVEGSGSADICLDYCKMSWQWLRYRAFCSAHRLGRSDNMQELCRTRK